MQGVKFRSESELGDSQNNLVGPTRLLRLTVRDPYREPSIQILNSDPIPADLPLIRKAFRVRSFRFRNLVGGGGCQILNFKACVSQKSIRLDPNAADLGGARLQPGNTRDESGMPES